jgi:hypothetical protein
MQIEIEFDQDDITPIAITVDGSARFTSWDEVNAFIRSLRGKAFEVFDIDHSENDE